MNLEHSEELHPFRLLPVTTVSSLYRIIALDQRVWKQGMTDLLVLEPATDYGVILAGFDARSQGQLLEDWCYYAAPSWTCDFLGHDTEHPTLYYKLKSLLITNGFLNSLPTYTVWKPYFWVRSECGYLVPRDRLAARGITITKPE